MSSMLCKLNTVQKSLPPELIDQSPLVMVQSMQHLGYEPYKVCSNDDLRLNITFIDPDKEILLA